MGKQNSIYIVSGPCGVGKSTITKGLALEMEEVVLLEGDKIHSMFNGESQPTWDIKLSIAWENILSLTKNFIKNDLNVIIDFVVESELEWFCKQLTEHDVCIHYVVLRAERELLVDRLKNRGAEDLTNRSLFLLEQLENEPSNKKYLYDTTNKQPKQIINDLRNRFEQYRV